MALNLKAAVVQLYLLYHFKVAFEAFLVSLLWCDVKKVVRGAVPLLSFQNQAEIMVNGLSAWGFLMLGVNGITWGCNGGMWCYFLRLC